MVKNIILDVTCKKSITACAIEHKGSIVKTHTFLSSYDNQYENLIEGYTAGVNLVRQYIESNMRFEGTLVIVTNNVVFVGWLRNNTAPDKYMELFRKLTSLIDSLPVKTDFVRNVNLVSDKYAKKTLVRNNYTGIDSFLD